MRLGSDAVLVLSGRDIQIKSLELEGALFAEVGPRASLVIEGATVKNRGWAWQAVKEGPGKRPATEEEAIRCPPVCVCWTTRQLNPEHHAIAFWRPSAVFISSWQCGARDCTGCACAGASWSANGRPKV